MQWLCANITEVEMKTISFIYTLVEEKERYLDRLDDDFSTLIAQILKFDELQYDILTQMDPQLLTKFDETTAEIEVWSRNFMYSCYCFNSVLYNRFYGSYGLD